ncbi:MAG: hypothetical protein ACOCSE_00110 [Chitinivibrionales bacterium]
MDIKTEKTVKLCKKRIRSEAVYRLKRVFLPFITVFTLALALITVVFSVFPWTGLPIFLDILLISGVIYTAAGVVVVLRRLPDIDKAAVLLERENPGSHHFLSSAVEASIRDKRDTSLIKSIIKRAENSAERYKPNPYKNNNLNLILPAAGILLLISALFASSPLVFAWWDLPLTVFKKPQWDISPGSCDIPMNSDIELRCSTGKEEYPSCILTIKNNSEEEIRRILTPDSTGNFSYSVEDADKSFSYRFSARGITSPEYHIKTVPPPSLRYLSLKLQPPLYTGLKDRKLPEGQKSFSALAGTRVHIDMESHYPLKSASVFTDTIVELDINDTSSAAGIFPVAHQGKAALRLEDTLDQINDTAALINYSIKQDNLPEVRVVKPGKNTSLDESMEEDIVVEALDDFGIKQIALSWHVSAEGKLNKRVITESSGAKPLVQKSLTWDISGCGMYPGDTLFYWAEATDNKPWGGGRVSKSYTFFFRFPSTREMHKNIEDNTESAQSTVESTKEGNKSIKENLRQLERNSLSPEKKELSWEDKKIVDDLKKEIKTQQDSLDKAMKKLEEASEKLKESGAEEITQKMEEIRKSVKELSEMYGDSLLFNIDSMDNDISMDDFRKKINDMSEMMPDLEEQLEKTQKHLDQLEKEQEKRLLAERAEKLSEEQNRLMEETGESTPKRQERLSKEVDSLLKDVDNTMQSEPPSSKEVKDFNKKIEESASSGKKPENSDMQGLSATLQSLSGDIRSSLSSNMQKRAQEDMKRLKSMASNIHEIAKWQEEVTSGAFDKKTAVSAENSIDEALKQEAERLDSMSMLPVSALQQIQSGIDKASGDISLAAEKGPNPYGEEAQSSLNSLSDKLLSMSGGKGACNQGGSSPGGSGGMMGGLQKLSGKQAALNSLTQQLMQKMLSDQKASPSETGKKPGGKGSGKAAAKTQEEIAERLKELREKYKDDPGASDNLKKRAEELEKEARRIAGNLKNIDKNDREDQEMLLSRMLEATLSINKKGKGDKDERKSQTSERLFSDKDPDGSVQGFKGSDTYYLLRKKILNGDYPEKYIHAIQAYLNKLGTYYLRDEESGSGSP